MATWPPCHPEARPPAPPAQPHLSTRSPLPQIQTGPLWGRVPPAGWNLPPVASAPGPASPWGPQPAGPRPRGARPGPQPALPPLSHGGHLTDSQPPPAAGFSSSGFNGEKWFPIKYSCQAKPKIGRRGRRVTLVRHKGDDVKPRGFSELSLRPSLSPTEGPENPPQGRLHGHMAWVATQGHPRRRTLICSMLCGHHLEILNNFEQGAPVFILHHTL